MEKEKIKELSRLGYFTAVTLLLLLLSVCAIVPCGKWIDMITIIFILDILLVIFFFVSIHYESRLRWKV